MAKTTIRLEREAVDLLRQALDAITVAENLHGKLPRPLTKVADAICTFLTGLEDCGTVYEEE
jgi:hypothetical protein